jgi:hypothetical protein
MLRAMTRLGENTMDDPASLDAHLAGPNQLRSAGASFGHGLAVEDVLIADLDRPVGHFRRLGHGISRVRVEKSVSAR